MVTTWGKVQAKMEKKVCKKSAHKNVSSLKKKSAPSGIEPWSSQLDILCTNHCAEHQP